MYTTEARRKIQTYLDELEIKIKNSKTYWRRCDSNFDKKFVQTFVDSHYNGIVHHISEIKKHLEKISHGKKELADVKVNFIRKYSPTPDHDDQKPAVHNQNENAIKRSVEEKQRFKALRASRCSSSKYVHQWEKMIDQHMENPVKEVKRRPKSETNSKDKENDDVPKIMVKSRVQLFEKKQKKRASSTIDAFLDFCLEKPSRSTSCHVIENIQELEEPETTTCCDFETAIGDNVQISNSDQDHNTGVTNEKSENTVKAELSDIKIDLSNAEFKSCLDICQKEELPEINIKVNDENEQQNTEKHDESNLHSIQSCVNVLHSKETPDSSGEENGHKDTTKKEDPEESCVELNSKDDLPKVVNNTPETTKNVSENNEHTAQGPSGDKCVTNIIENKSVASESKTDLLDDVNALIEDDHLKIVKIRKDTPNQNTDASQQEVKNVQPPESEAPNTKHPKNIEEQAPCTKPRIVALHVKKNIPPDAIF